MASRFREPRPPPSAQADGESDAEVCRGNVHTTRTIWHVARSMRLVTSIMQRAPCSIYLFN
jgi:hypothetical protein